MDVEEFHVLMVKENKRERMRNIMSVFVRGKKENRVERGRGVKVKERGRKKKRKEVIILLWVW